MYYSKILDTPGQVFFGPFPSQSDIDKFIKNNNINLIVDLTEHEELGTHPYHVDIDKIKFPIVDGYPPNDWSGFCKLMVKLAYDVRCGKNIFIHCRAGHGRSSMVSASLLCQLDYTLHPELAIKCVADIHSKRDGLSLKWKKIYNPQTRMQQIFIYKYFSTIFFIHSSDSSYQIGLCTLSPHPVTLKPNLTFPNAEAAFQYLKDPEDENFVEKLLDSRKSSVVKLIGDDHWYKGPNQFCEYKGMYEILKLKFAQHQVLRDNLLKTYSKRLFDGYFQSHPHNLVGRVLMQIRDEFARAQVLQDEYENRTEQTSL